VPSTSSAASRGAPFDPTEMCEPDLDAPMGGREMDGLGMLLHQARPGFAAWFGTDPEVDEALRESVLAGL